MDPVREVVVARDAAVTWLTLNRPDRLNALNAAMYEQLWHALLNAEADANTKVVVLAGSGRAFCSGADLRAHAASERMRAQAEQYGWLGQHVSATIHGMAKPVIAGIHGYAVGGGAELALACDFVVMGRTAQMFFPEVGLGTYVTGGLTHRLPQLVGLARAKILLMTGTRMTGEQAKNIGLVAESTDDDMVFDRCKQLAGELSHQHSLPLSRLKQDLNAWSEKGMAKSLRDEVLSLADCMETKDWRNQVEGFVQQPHGGPTP